MQYYSNNVELAKIYKVSESAVRNWIKSAVEKKLALQIIEKSDKHYIATTSKNNLLMEELSEKGKKFKNRKSFKTLYPHEKFYELFDHSQVVDIISNLEIHKEIPHQYGYFDGGVEYWDKYSYKMLKDKGPNNLTNTIEVLDTNFNAIQKLVINYDLVNIVDIGVGNGLPVKQFIQKLIEINKFNKYIGIDYSSEMLDLAKRNLKDWFGEDFRFEGYTKDINYEKFTELLFDNTQINDGNKYFNILCLLGSTTSNQRNTDLPLATIAASMKSNDIILFTKKLDTENSRRYFDFSTEDSGPNLEEQDKLVLDLLNIHEDYYEIERYYDHDKRSRFIGIELKTDLEIVFEKDNYIKKLYLHKNDKINLWRAKHQTFEETLNQFAQTGYDVLHASRSLDQEEIFVMAQIKKN